MWPWRDWVIRAYNENKPFDQFTIEQLAGDLLPNPLESQVVATGFNRNHRLNGEGGRIVEEWFVESVIDRLETTGSTWMALTFNCCRCHDHKYDPISQKEFFQLFAYFNSNEESGVLGDFGGAASTRKGGNTPPLLLLADADAKQKIAAADAALADAQAALKNAGPSRCAPPPAPAAPRSRANRTAATSPAARTPRTTPTPSPPPCPRASLPACCSRRYPTPLCPAAASAVSPTETSSSAMSP